MEKIDVEMENVEVVRTLTDFINHQHEMRSDRSGTVIDGNVEKVTDNMEAWTFARKVFGCSDDCARCELGDETDCDLGGAVAQLGGGDRRAVNRNEARLGGLAATFTFGDRGIQAVIHLAGQQAAQLAAITLGEPHCKSACRDER